MTNPILDRTVAPVLMLFAILWEALDMLLRTAWLLVSGVLCSIAAVFFGAERVGLFIQVWHTNKRTDQ